MMGHWVNSYMNKGWAAGATGPDNYDCYQLVREVQRAKFGVDMPVIDVNGKSLLAVIRAMKNDVANLDWLEINRPEDGCLVKLFKSENPDHVGVFLAVEDGGVLHCSQGIGVSFDSVFQLKALGWNNIKYYRHKSKWEK